MMKISILEASFGSFEIIKTLAYGASIIDEKMKKANPYGWAS